MASKLKLAVWAFTFGVIGVLASLLVLTMYEDHLMVRALYQVELNRAKISSQK